MVKFLKKNLATIILSIIFLIGIGLLAYPSVANWWNSNMASHAVTTYTKAAQNLDDSEIQEHFQKAREYNENLPQNSGRFHPTEEEHEQYLNAISINGDHVIGSIQIPTIKVELPVYLGTSEAALAMGAGHLEGSSLPIGGLGTHAVITGHRGLPSAKLFTDLDQMVEGDYVILHTLNQTLTYQIDQIRVVLPDQLEDLEIESDKDLLTLVTCTPYGINSHRLLLTGHRVENLPEDFTGDAEAKMLDSKMVALFIAIPILIALFIWLLIRYRKPKTGDESED